MSTVSTHSRSGLQASGSSALPVWLIVLIALIYLISPIDVLPDFVPLVGQCDDLAVLGVAAFHIVRRLRSAGGRV